MVTETSPRSHASQTQVTEAPTAEPPPRLCGLIIHDRELFDEDFYLQRHTDVAEALARGEIPSGWRHYEFAGRRERREVRVLDFDERHYLRAYPQAVEDIASGLAADAVEHYLSFGKGRGYLRNLRAPRPDYAAAPVSRFGGLWPDLPNARDLIADKLEIGQITEEEAERLRFWIEHGYVILRGAIASDLIDGARAALEDAYSGKFERQLFECGTVTGDRGPSHWQREFNDFPAKALDIHFQSRAIRDAIFSDPIVDFLRVIFESRALASQTLGFWRGSSQLGHQDTAYVAYSHPRNFAASWIALEDVTIGAGELFYHDGSHVLPDYMFGGAYKSGYDYRRMTDHAFSDEEVDAFEDSLRVRAKEQGFPRLPFAAKMGDALIWHADLVHGGAPISQAVTRKSLVTHYCPHRLAPLFFEEKPVPLYRHGAHRFCSGLYVNQAPAGLDEASD